MDDVNLILHTPAGNCLHLRSNSDDVGNPGGQDSSEDSDDDDFAGVDRINSATTLL